MYITGFQQRANRGNRLETLTWTRKNIEDSKFKDTVNPSWILLGALVVHTFFFWFSAISRSLACNILVPGIFPNMYKYTQPYFNSTVILFFYRSSIKTQNTQLTRTNLFSCPLFCKYDPRLAPLFRGSSADYPFLFVCQEPQLLGSEWSPSSFELVMCPAQPLSLTQGF